MAFKRKYKKRSFKKAKKSGLKKTIKTVIKSEISKARENKFFVRTAGTTAGDNRVDLLGQLGSNFEITSQIRKLVLSPVANIDLPRQFRTGNKIKIIGIKYCLRWQPDMTSGSEQENYGRIVVISTASPALSSTGTLLFSDITLDYLDNVGGRTSVTPGDLTAYPLDNEIIKKVYMDRTLYGNGFFNGITLNGNSDRIPIIHGYIPINKVYQYKDVVNASTFVPADNERLMVLCASDSTNAPHPILEGYWKIIFEDM